MKHVHQRFYEGSHTNNTRSTQCYSEMEQVVSRISDSLTHEDMKLKKSYIHARKEIYMLTSENIYSVREEVWMGHVITRIVDRFLG